MQSKKEIGQYIAEKRKAQELTQAEVANLLFVDVSTVSKWERGVAYPDITMISSLCKVLNISEHEFITASDDSELRKIKNQSQKYTNISNAYFWGFTAAYITAIVVCFIVNLAVDKTLSWFFIVLCSCMLAFTLVPSFSRFLTKHKLLILSSSFMLALFLLLLTCAIYTQGDWLFIAYFAILLGYSLIMLPMLFRIYFKNETLRKNIPMITVGVAFLFLIALLAVTATNFLNGIEISLFCVVPVVLIVSTWSYLKINIHFKNSITFAVSGIFVLVCNSVINLIEGLEYVFLVDFTNWSDDAYFNGNVTLLTCLALVFVAVVFLIIGLNKHLKLKNNNSNNKAN